MSTGVLDSGVTAGLSAAVDEVAGGEFARLGEDELLDVVREVERARRRLGAVEARLIAEVEERNLPGKYVMPSTAALLAAVLNLSPREAASRVRHTRHLGPRLTVTGERLAPLLPATAAARTAGSITAQHVSVIIRAIDRLPITLPVQQIADAEAFLVEQAKQFDATMLAGIAQRLLDTLNPDGTLTDENQQQRRRFLSLVPMGMACTGSPRTWIAKPPRWPVPFCTHSPHPNHQLPATETNAPVVNGCTTPSVRF